MPLQACQSGLVSSNTLMGIAVPLLQQAILEGLQSSYDSWSPPPCAVAHPCNEASRN